MQFYNTRTRGLQEFEPLKPNEVTVYTCGPTVYQTAHLGNFRTYIFSDLLRRVLEYSGFAVRHVMNITDVGHLTGDADEGQDKVEESAKKEHKTAWEVASYYTEQFWSDADRLNILRPSIIAKATDHIPEQIALIERLEERGFTYKTSDGVYFSVEKFPAYGELSGQRLSEKEAGARVDVNTEKHHPADFALWKFSDSESHRQMEWASPWGVGFPGWHIECSAMSTKYLGQPFDIHTGGADHIATHHENEIAQSEAAFDAPLANYWLHAGFMLVDGEKMSKSLGNVFTVDNLIERGHNPLAFRLLALMTHYRKPLNFTWEALEAAEQALHKLIMLVRNLPKPDEGMFSTGLEQEVSDETLLRPSEHSERLEKSTSVPEDLEEQFRTFISDDLGIPQALALLWEVLKSDRLPEEKASIVAQWDQVFGLGLARYLGDTPEIPEDILQLASEREKYRQAGSYSQADLIRDELLSRGYELQDGPTGPTVVPHTGATLL